MKLLSPGQALPDIALCVVFFTRLPLPAFDTQGRRLADAIWAAPLAGLVVALPAAGAYALADTLGVPAGPAAALALLTAMLVSGCLHEDGLSDTADGFGGGATRERRLEIMRDSRIGSYGACALGASLLLRWSALAALTGGPDALAALVAAHAASRALVPAFLHLVPPARGDGLSARAGHVFPEAALGGLAIGLLTLIPLGLSGVITALALLAALFFAFRVLCLYLIGGQTGDIAGALQQMAEATILIVAAAVLT